MKEENKRLQEIVKHQREEVERLKKQNLDIMDLNIYWQKEVKYLKRKKHQPSHSAQKVRSCLSYEVRMHPLIKGEINFSNWFIYFVFEGSC